MSGYYSSNTLLDLGKNRMREFQEEQKAANLTREAQNFQPGPIRATLKQVASLFKPFVLKAENRFGRAIRKQVATLRAQTSLRSTHLGL
jgi:hypothetical protein